MAPLVPIAVALLTLVAPSMVSAHRLTASPGAESSLRVVGASEDCLPPINAARTIRMETPLKALQSDNDLERKAIETLQTKALKDTTKDECVSLTINKDMPGLLTQKSTPAKADSTTQGAPKQGEADKFNCVANIDQIVAKGLDKVTDHEAKYSDATYKTNNFTLSFGSLFYDGSGKYGCARTVNCKGGNDSLYCVFDKDVPDNSTPIKASVFEAITKRKEAGLTIEKLLTEAQQDSGSVAGLALPAVISLAALYHL